MNNTQSLIERPNAAAVDLLRQADALLAEALLALADIRSWGIHPMTALEARMLPWEFKSLRACAIVLRRMPRLAGLLADAQVSASQVRGICRELTAVRGRALAAADEFIARRAPALACAEPAQLIQEVADLVVDLAAVQAEAALDKDIETEFLSLQPRLAGGGGALYGQAGPESFATICAAIDAAAGEPCSQDWDVSRARQRMAGLVAVCEGSLAGSGSARPKPRFFVSMDAATGAAYLHTPIARRPQRLSHTATQMLLCDAELFGVLFDGSQPIATSAKTDVVPERTRRAILARDGGCRFPGCDAPAAWSDCHHIRWRYAGGGHEVKNLVLLCRRHHRLVHRRRWQITHRDGGGMAFAHGGRSYVSMPRARPPRE